MKNLAYFLAPLLLLACGDDDDSTDSVVIDGAVPGIDSNLLPIDGGFDAAPDFDAPPAAPMVLTSTAVEEGAMLANQYTCAGVDISPPLAWTAGPQGTLSYAITFIDLDNGSNGFPHSTIYDIPTSVLALPQDVEKEFEPSEVPGAKQSVNFYGRNDPTDPEAPHGYAGPCPGSVHTYQFTLHALDVATIPGIGTTTTPADAVAAIQEHSIASATLSVESD